ncbi:hypothetical protein FHR83_006651 [Actinoplanes campanulatus]|uniref:Uncharacterized protein n=1 Tax=Actinoplanes campanulatus TaxID=113559 RepID=A0A7W5AMS3_9ACTN|nr:hypothetical protein [Actinoplanes campanulatus]MBB3098945.1 hypothetical protein [Actinoplanes campanulatus]GGN39737.1 hypothetical protein GCM10010109_68050 [Actinoplanes campanulatus]
MTIMTETRTWTLSIPAPERMLSANSKPHHRVAGVVRKAWREATYLYAQQAKLPTGLDRVRIDIVLHHTVNRNRDDANWHPYVGKPITDALGPERRAQSRNGAVRIDAGYGLIPDDNPTHLDGPFISLGEKVSRKEYPRGLAVVTIVDLTGQPTDGFETERRVMSATTAWTFRCPARHQVVVTMRGQEDPGPYRDLFMSEHAGCEVTS